MTPSHRSRRRSSTPSTRTCPTPSGRGPLTWTWVGGLAWRVGPRGDRRLPKGHSAGGRDGSPALHRAPPRGVTVSCPGEGPPEILLPEHFLLRCGASGEAHDSAQPVWTPWNPRHKVLSLHQLEGAGIARSPEEVGLGGSGCKPHPLMVTGTTPPPRVASRPDCPGCAAR